MSDDSRIFSDTAVTHGPLLFVSGQVPVADDGTVPDDFTGQARLVADRIAALLDANGVGWGAVSKVTYFLRDMADLAALRQVMREVLGAHRPASSLVEVSGLVDPRFRLEVEAMAQLP